MKDVLPHLGEHDMGHMYGFPDFGPPILDYGCVPPIKYVYHVVIHDYPRYWGEALFPIEDYIREDDPIAWAKTTNTIGQPVDWWNWTEGGGFEFYDQLPIYHPTFNNFPHPQGLTNSSGWPTYWPGDPDDHCHWDWLKRSLWPFYLDEAVCADMLLEMLIDDWGTWAELFEEDVHTVPRWVI